MWVFHEVKLDGIVTTVPWKNNVKLSITKCVIDIMNERKVIDTDNCSKHHCCVT